MENRVKTILGENCEILIINYNVLILIMIVIL